VSVRKKIVGPAADAGALDGERLVSPAADAHDDADGATLRPRTFEDYVGQAQIVDNLKIAIDAAKRRGESLEHVLFSGPPGLGKTTLAGLIARELGGALRPTSGPTLEKPKDLVGILTALETGDILFIDEIHRLGSVVEEYLYPAMEDFQIDFLVDSGAYAKTLKLPLKRFTLVGATTRAGMLSAPLRDRFGIMHHLERRTRTDRAAQRAGPRHRDRCGGRGDDRRAQPRHAAHRKPPPAPRARLRASARGRRHHRRRGR